jgi:hypothetical protein
MMRNQTTNFWNTAAQLFLGSIALALVTLVSLSLALTSHRPPLPIWL